VGPDAAPLDVLPTIWFRNRWSWDLGAVRPSLRLEGGAQQNVAAQCVRYGRRILAAGAGPDGKQPEALSATTTPTWRSFGGAGAGLPERRHLRPCGPQPGLGEPCPHRHQGGAALPLGLAAGATVQIRLRFGAEAGDLGNGFTSVINKRRQEADELPRQRGPGRLDGRRSSGPTSGRGGMLWCKQFYHFDVQRWLDGDPAQPAPPPQRREGRNCGGYTSPITT